MSRIPQLAGKRGSLKWIQSAINDHWETLEQPIAQGLGGERTIEWRSPLEADEFAEYRDGDFLDVVGLSRLRPDLTSFWPARGPQWDALGVTERADVLLIEAKAHVGEMCSPATGAGEASRKIIEERLSACAGSLGARAGHAPWTDQFYQLGNRLAHLQFLRDRDVSAYLVLVNFINDEDMRGPTTREAWEAAYQVALHVMGLGARHPLSRYVIHVYPDVGGRSARHDR